jgi:hypothetical protein
MLVLQNKCFSKNIMTGQFVIMEHLLLQPLQLFQKDLKLSQVVGSKNMKKQYMLHPVLFMQVIRGMQKLRNGKVNIFN